MATISFEVGGNAVVRVVRVVRSCIDTDLNPSKETVIKVITEIDVLGEWVVRAVRLLNTPHVVRVRGDALRVGVVWVGILHGTAQHLVPEQLANVSHGPGAYIESFVGKQSRIQMSQEVGVSCTSLVVTGADVLELDYTVAVGLLNATQVSRVPSAGGVVARRRNATTIASV